MVKVQFPTSVKYDGELIPANTPFSIKAEDLEELKAAGAFVIQNDEPVEEPVAEEPVEVVESVVEPEPVVTPEPEPEVVPPASVEEKKLTLSDMVDKAPAKTPRSRKVTK